MRSTKLSHAGRGKTENGPRWPRAPPDDVHEILCILISEVRAVMEQADTVIQMIMETYFAPNRAPNCKI